MRLRIVLLGVMLLAIWASVGLLWPSPANVVHSGSESNVSDPSELRSAAAATPQSVDLEEQSHHAASVVGIPAEEQTRWIEDSPQSEALLRRFISETRTDAVWATQVGSRIFEAIADSPNRPGFSAIDIDCRKTICRVELNLASQVPANRSRPLPAILTGGMYGTQLLEEFSEAGEFDVVLYSGQPDDTGNPIVVFYLERE